MVVYVIFILVKESLVFQPETHIVGWRSWLAHGTHDPRVASSSLAPATKLKYSELYLGI